jgi:glucose/arabinose dehydrogenase
MQTLKTLNSNQHRLRAVTLGLLLAASLAACGDTSKLPPGADIGATPTLPPPTKTLIPTVHIAEASGWPVGVMPVPAAGLRVTALASGLDHPRWIHVLPNGDVLVAESNKPPKPDAGFSLKGWIMGLVMKRAGAGVPSANRITLLRDLDGDGVAETRTVFLQGLNSPFGMALIGNNFYVANTDGVVRFPYETGQTTITAPATR